MKSATTRSLRANLRATMARAARGEEVIVTRRGEPYVRLLPATPRESAPGRYPLRGSVLRMDARFDTPIRGLWNALRR